MKKLKYHPAANIFPMMSAEETDGILQDIDKEGQRYAIELHEGKILDGRNRYEVCQTLGIECETIDVTNDIDDPVAHVLSVNLHRRHLNASQRAMVATRTREVYEAIRKEQQRVRKGKQPGTSMVNLPYLSKGTSRDDAGKAVGVSGSMVDRARNVIDRGTPELIDAVDGGLMTVNMAQKVIDLPAKEQRQIAKAEELTKEAKRILKEKKEAEEEPSRDKPTMCLRHAHAAVDCLRRIPRNDKHKKRAFQIVTDFIEQQSK